MNSWIHWNSKSWKKRRGERSKIQFNNVFLFQAIHHNWICTEMFSCSYKPIRRSEQKMNYLEIQKLGAATRQSRPIFEKGPWNTWNNDWWPWALAMNHDLALDMNLRHLEELRCRWRRVEDEHSTVMISYGLLQLENFLRCRWPRCCRWSCSSDRCRWSSVFSCLWWVEGSHQRSV